MEKQIAIIGAGISGLLACKYTLSKGFKPVIFEARNKIGGVWTSTTETTKLQTPKPGYQFSDFPWPDSVTQLFPDQNQVLNYLQSYARHFDLLKHIKFNTKVLGIRYEGGPSDEEIMLSWSLWGGNGEPFNSKGKWIVEALDTESLSTEVDFVILCIGRFSNVPNIPGFPPDKGAEVFDGEVMHSMDYANMDNGIARNFVKGKRVTVVGFQKFAMDIAMECSAANGVELPCRVLYRTEHWNLPDSTPWGVPLPYLYLNRFAELMVHKPGEGFLLSLLASILAPLRWTFSKLVESHIKKKLPLAKFGMIPKHSFLQDFSSCSFPNVPQGFYDRVEEGSILLKKAPSFSFYREGINVHGEVTSSLDTDLVILATGFDGAKKLKDIFLPKIFQDSILGSSNAAVPLYRECIHPRIPQLAVIGFSEAASNLYASELRCRWLAELLVGTFKTPSIKEMEKDAAKWKQ